MEIEFSFGDWIARRRRALGLTQRELAGAAHCSEVLIRKIEADERRPSASVAAQLAAQLQIPEGAHALFIAVARGERMVAQLGAADALPAPAAPVRSGALPAPPNRLIGRAAEVSQVCTLLGDPMRRLVTIAGSPGIGKTRLAQHVAHALADTFADGVWYLSLAPLQRADQAPAALINLFEIALRDRPVAVALRAYLRGRSLLIVLDNCEHLEELAPEVALLLADAPGLRILTTSRAPLRLAAEHLFPLPALSTEAAAALFAARTAMVRPDLDLTSEHAAIDAICALLDRLPLAIELAAARVRIFGVATLLDRLRGDRLGELRGGARDLPPHQRDLTRTIQWSYELLQPAEQACLRALGVFAGGWDLGAAAAVVGDTVVDHLAALLDQSLITFDGARYGMLETIRDFARRELSVCGEEEAAQQRHATYFCALAVRSEPALWTDAQQRTCDMLFADVDNLRAALACLTDPSADAARAADGARMAFALELFWMQRTTRYEGRRWARAALDAPAGLPEELRAHVLFAYGELCSQDGVVDEAERALLEGLSICRRIDAPLITARVLHALAEVYQYFGDVPRAIAYAEEGRTYAERSGDANALGWLLLDIGGESHLLGDNRRACEALDAAAALFAETRSWVGAFYCHFHMAFILLDTGNFARAAEVIDTMRPEWDELPPYHYGVLLRLSGRLQEAEAFFARDFLATRQANDLFGIAITGHELGVVYLLRGEYAAAVTAIEQANIACRESAKRWVEVAIGQALGVAYLLCGRLDEAQGTLCAAEQLLRTLSPGTRAADLMMAGVLEGRAALAAARGLEDEAVWLWEQAERLRSAHATGHMPGRCVAPLPPDFAPIAAWRLKIAQIAQIED
jgi:predicted ATPase/transcriptional regulator with XRE-family HTH domain